MSIMYFADLLNAIIIGSWGSLVVICIIKGCGPSSCAVECELL